MRDGHLSAEKVLITGGVLNLAYGGTAGICHHGDARAKGAPATPRYLMAAHVGTLLQAAILLGLVGSPAVHAWARAGRMWPPGSRSVSPTTLKT